MSAEFMGFREPSASERRLLAVIATRAKGLNPDWLDELQVATMDDGGMGSLRLLVHGASSTERLYGKTVAEYEFTDSDGVKVLCALNVDQLGLPFELDVWKTDFRPLIRIPDDLS